MTVNCKGNLIDLSTPRIMGILNLTPDSFYDGGRFQDSDAILAQTEKMLTEGATFIDMGAYSSRPGADDVTEDEELRRLMPIVELLLKTFPDILLSIDTFRSKVAKTCLEVGATMINDISAGKLDGEMLATVAEFKVPFIMMHMKGSPRTMQQQISYENILVEIMTYFSERINAATSLGLIDLLIDPGFGFSKTLDQNYEILQNLEVFQNIERPVLVGLSRKSMIYKALYTDAQNALNGTTALNMVALLKGAHILRVHDVKEAFECSKLAERLRIE